MDLKSIQQLQTDIAELFNLMGVDFVKPSVEVDGTETVSVELVNNQEEGEDKSGMGLLIGNHGETLLAIEFITALMVNSGRENWYRVKLDVDGYRKRREDELRQLALKMADKAKFLNESIELRPMASADRRVIHTVVAEMGDVVSESVGEGRDRRVIIKPAR